MLSFDGIFEINSEESVPVKYVYFIMVNTCITRLDTLFAVTKQLTLFFIHLSQRYLFRQSNLINQSYEFISKKKTNIKKVGKTKRQLSAHLNSIDF